MNYNLGECFAEMGSVTQAIKAKNILDRTAIPCDIAKKESNSKKGCVYIVRFSCSQANNVRTILNGAKITVKQWHTN